MAKLCPCGGEPVLSTSLRRGSCLWCQKCQTTLTKDYWFDYMPWLEWVHGLKTLPRCPMCKLPPTVEGAGGPDPQVTCHMPGDLNCLGGKKYPLDEWIKHATPEQFAVKRLAERWKKECPEWKKPRELLMRAIRRDARTRAF